MMENFFLDERSILAQTAFAVTGEAMSTTTMHNEDGLVGNIPTYGMTTEQASVRLDLTVGRIKQLCADGTLDAIKVPGGRGRDRWAISELSVERFDEARQEIERIRQNMKGGSD